jgi:hypothetical protein
MARTICQRLTIGDLSRRRNDKLREEHRPHRHRQMASFAAASTLDSYSHFKELTGFPGRRAHVLRRAPSGSNIVPPPQTRLKEIVWVMIGNRSVLIPAGV